MPTPEELERQVRRRAVGRTITEICRDLALVPGFCTPAFWNGMFEVIHYFGGSVETLMREKAHREQAFIREQDRKLGSTLDWLQLKRDEIRQRLGFFIGEPPVDPRRAIGHRPTLTRRGVADHCPKGPDNSRPRPTRFHHRHRKPLSAQAGEPAPGTDPGGREGVKLPVHNCFNFGIAGSSRHAGRRPGIHA